MTIAPFLLAAQGQRATHTPVWFMRQAGRSLPEYRARRGEGSILDAIKQPDLAAELTLQPVRRYGVDAAVLYSDIVVPAHAVGFGIDVAPGTGPVCEQPLRTAADLDRLREFEPEAELQPEFQAAEPEPEPVRKAAPKAEAEVVVLPRSRSAPARAKAAFTLRLDPDRHLKLRLACALSRRSAQQLVTEALDNFLDSLPELEALAGHVPEQASQR